jgi:hypothetical protein
MSNEPDEKTLAAPMPSFLKLKRILFVQYEALKEAKLCVIFQKDYRGAGL